MKTPERIKRNLEDALLGSSNYCPYKYSFICNSKLIADALDLIEQLESDNERIKKNLASSTERENTLADRCNLLLRERDAAIEDIKVAATFLCQTCKKYHPAVIDGTKHFCDEIPAYHFDDGAIACGMYEWRGVKEEKDEKA